MKVEFQYTICVGVGMLSMNRVIKQSCKFYYVS